MARGEVLGCFSLTEAHGGSDPGNMKTHAKRDGDDWILNGSKMWITNGTIADSMVLFGRPLSHAQSIQIRLAEMARRITISQLLAFRITQLKDAGQLRPAEV